MTTATMRELCRRPSIWSRRQHRCFSRRQRPHSNKDRLHSKKVQNQVVLRLQSIHHRQCSTWVHQPRSSLPFRNHRISNQVLCSQRSHNTGFLHKSPLHFLVVVHPKRIRLVQGCNLVIPGVLINQLESRLTILRNLSYKPRLNIHSRCWATWTSHRRSHQRQSHKIMEATSYLQILQLLHQILRLICSLLPRPRRVQSLCYHP